MRVGTLSANIARGLVAVAVVVIGTGACGPQASVNGPAANVCVKTLTGDVQVPKQQAADILIVVDNSGSMADKQANLVANFLNQNAGECPLQDLANIPAGFKNPKPELYTGNGPLAKCGFIQLVAAFDNDFRIGVITTDVGLCDNRIASALGGPGWGYRPQRGCLHGDDDPAKPNVRKVIARADLTDADPTNDDFAARFQATLENVGVFGSPIERGLDAMNVFLDPNATRAPGCENDLSLFRRKDASLVVIFLSDENDCSHGLAPESFGDEFNSQTCTKDADCQTPQVDDPTSPCVGGFCQQVCGEFASGLTSIDGTKCYAHPEQLSPVDAYVQPLLKIDPHAKVAVIAGADDANSPSACATGGDGLAVGDNGICFPSGGAENETQDGAPCGANETHVFNSDTGQFVNDRGGLPCCLADSGSRYFDFATHFGERAVNSVCNASFRDTMIQIAALVAAVDEVELAEPPDDPNAIIVELTKADGTKVDLSPVPSTQDCTTTDGYQLQDGTHILLCGNGRAGPGDSIAVRARGGVKSQECNQPYFEASGGGVRSCSSAGIPASLGALGLALLAIRRVRRR